MVAWNGEKEVMAAATSHPFYILSLLLAKASCFRWAMTLAMDYSLQRMCFETEQLLQWCKKKMEGLSYLDLISRDCCSRISAFDFVCLTFVRCSGNFIADFLAKNASTLLTQYGWRRFP